MLSRKNALWHFELYNFIVVIPAGALQLSSGQDSSLLTMQGGTGGATIVQYTSGQDGQFYVPG